MTLPGKSDAMYLDEAILKLGYSEKATKGNVKF